MPVLRLHDVLSTLTERAAARGIEVGELVNEILKKGIALSEALR